MKVRGRKGQLSEVILLFHYKPPPPDQPGGVKRPGCTMQLTVHGVVAGGGLDAEAAPPGEALWPGEGGGATGEALFAGEAAP